VLQAAVFPRNRRPLNSPLMKQGSAEPENVVFPSESKPRFT